MSEPTEKRKTLVQRVAQVFVGESKHSEPEIISVPEKPSESQEKAAERLAAYQKLCEQEAQNAPAGAPKKIKYRAADFNSGPRPGVRS